MGHVWHGNRQQLKESRLFPCGNSYSLRGDHWTEWPEGSWLEAPMLLRAVPDGGRLRPCWSRGDFPLSLVMCCWWCWDASFKASPWSGSLTPSSPAHPPHTLPNLCCALIMYSKPSESWVEYWLLFYPQSRDPYLPLLLGPATNTFHGGRFSAEYPLPSIDSGVHHWTPSTRLNTWQGVGGSNICWMARQMKSLQSCQSPICPSYSVTSTHDISTGQLHKPETWEKLRSSSFLSKWPVKPRTDASGKPLPLQVSPFPRIAVSCSCVALIVSYLISLPLLVSLSSSIHPPATIFLQSSDNITCLLNPAQGLPHLQKVLPGPRSRLHFYGSPSAPARQAPVGWLTVLPTFHNSVPSCKPSHPSGPFSLPLSRQM